MAISRLTPSTYKDTYVATQAAVSGETEGTVTGGTEVTSGDYKYHVFTSSSTLSVTGGSKELELLMIGGGGGANFGTYLGGGGCGQIVSGQSIYLNNTTVTITVGAGGTSFGSNALGSPSEVKFGSIILAVANGGGGGGLYHNGNQPTYFPITGGGGGGGVSYKNTGGTIYQASRAGAFGINDLSSTLRSGSADLAPNNTYGFRGGTSASGLNLGNGRLSAAGGGGAAVNGSSNGGQGGASGGAGTDAFDSWLQAISGSVSIGEDSGGVLYIGGGGGGTGYTGNVSKGAGGLGGGGAGTFSGDANTGGGGGGGGTAGGSGFVIIRYAV